MYQKGSFIQTLWKATLLNASLIQTQSLSYRVPLQPTFDIPSFNLLGGYVILENSIVHTKVIFHNIIQSVNA